MTTTPKSIGEDSLSGSWVEISVSPGRVTPVAVPAVGLISGGVPGNLSSQISEEYLRLLKEAQRDSNCPSSRVSLASSRLNSQCESPKSPPNSPNNELSNGDEDFKGIFINKESECAKEWILGYRSIRCDTAKFHSSRAKARLSFRNAKCGGKSVFSKEVMYTFFLSNLLSLLIGAGIGLWLSKRSDFRISQFPLN